VAHFAVWATACETALWEQETFLAPYSGNRNEAVENVISAGRAQLLSLSEENKSELWGFLCRVAQLARTRVRRPYPISTQPRS
jgi:hypothetical protein